MLTIIDFFTDKKVEEIEYKKLTMKQENNNIYELANICNSKNLNVKIYVTDFIQLIEIILDNGIIISGETFFVENGTIQIYNI